ncbi:MAG: DinB family protein [Vicinamibacterales bacterium]
MSETHRLVDELLRDHTGDPWHGSSVTTLLRGVTAPQAASRSVPHVHTVWQLVLHMTAWKNEARRRLAGGPAGDPEEGDWPDVGATTAERWKEALERLDAAHAALIEAVRALPESALFEPTNDPRNPATGAGVSTYVLLHGVVQHDAYHAGQIALLVKVVRTL